MTFPENKILHRTAMIAVSALFLFFSITASLDKSATYDEGIILASGNYSLRHFANPINTENPILTKSLLALPSMLLDLKIQQVEKDLQYSYDMGNEFGYGKAFLYENNADLILLLCRIVNMLIALTGGIFMYLLITLFMKPKWGVLGFAMFLFCPNIMAGSSVATVDIGVTVFMLGSVYFFLKALRTGSLKYYILTGLFAAFSMLSKYSGLLIWIIIPLQLSVFLLQSTDNRQRSTVIMNTFFSLLICLLAVNALYGNYSFCSLQEIRPVSPLLNGLAKIPVLSSFIPLPESYMKGFDIVCFNNSPGFPNIYIGEFYPEGGRWFDYYLIVSLLKIPIPLLILILTGAVSAFRRHWRRKELYLLLIPPLVIYCNFSFLAYRQLGIRYVLPAFPWLIACAVFGLKSLAEQFRISNIEQGISNIQGKSRKPGFKNIRFRVGHSLLDIGYSKLIAIILLIWFLAESCFVAWPDYLAYFNEFAGGPSGGKRYFAESNLDWGQDLPGLKKWLDSHGSPGIFLIYCGQADPGYYGIKQSSEPQFLAVGVTASYMIDNPDILKIINTPPVANIGNSIYIYRIKKQEDR